MSFSWTISETIVVGMIVLFFATAFFLGDIWKWI